MDCTYCLARQRPLHQLQAFGSIVVNREKIPFLQIPRVQGNKRTQVFPDDPVPISGSSFHFGLDFDISDLPGLSIQLLFMLMLT